MTDHPLVQLATGFFIGGMTLYALARPSAPVQSPKHADAAPEHTPSHKQAARAKPQQHDGDHQPSWMSKQSLVHDFNAEEPSWRASASFTAAPSSPITNGHHDHHQMNGHHHAETNGHHDELMVEEDDYQPSWMSSTSFVVEHVAEPDELPSWMSRSGDRAFPTPIKPVRLAAAQPQHGEPKLHAANGVVAHVAHLRSDAVFVYPVLDKGYLGETLARSAVAADERVHVCETRTGAGRVVVGMAEKGLSCAVLASSLSLNSMSGALLAMKGLPVVLHVAALASDDELALRADYTDVLAAREFGVAVLVSCDAQEAHDVAVIAHEAARALKQPVMHVLDGARVLNRTTEIATLAKPRLDGTYDSVAAVLQHSHALFAHHTAYAPFEFAGSHEADVVCIALGPSSKVIEHAVHASARLAAVRVRLLDPWLDDELVAALPRSVRRVCVLDESRDKALFGLVAKAVHGCSRLSVSLTLVTAPASSRGLTLHMADAMFDEVAAGEHAPAEVQLSPGHAFSLRQTKRALGKTVAWFVPAAAARDVEDAAVAVAEAVRGHHAPVAVAKAVDPLLGEHGCALVELRVGGAPSWAVDAGEADVVAAHYASQADAAAALRDGGVFIVLGSGEVPQPLRRRLVNKGAKVVRAESSCEFAHVLAAVQELDHAMFHAAVSGVAAALKRAHAGGLDAHALHERVAALHRPLVAAVPAAAVAPRRTGTPGLDGGDATSVHSADSGSQDENVFGLVPRLFWSGDKRDTEQASVHFVPHHAVAWSLLFRDAFGTGTALRPREHGTYQVRLTANKRLTPVEYERNIFHLEFDISGTGLTYQIGDALGVFGHNDEAEVEAFIRQYNATGGRIDPSSFVGFALADGRNELVSARNLLVQHLDLFGKPGKKFYVWLSGFATSRYEHLKLLHAGTDDVEAFKLNVAETMTFADLLLQHPSARPSIAELAKMVPAVKARHYSIASSMKLTPMSVHLLVVEVDWKTPSGRLRHGQCTRYLARLRPEREDVFVTVDVQPSVLRLPPDPRQPVLMAGLGTGMAPFRAFAQERKFQKESGMQVGPIVLYFGARHRHEEWLYGDEWDAFAKEGLVELRLAFSRDQKDKVYIQHKIQADAALVRKYMGEQGGFFYLCGPTWPVPDVTNAVAAGLDERFKATGDTSSVDRLKEEGRFILEVY